MAKSECPKCGSTETLDGVQVMDRSHNGGLQQFSAMFCRGPRAHSSILPKMYPFRARVCAGCGFTEFYMRLPAKPPRPAQRSPAPPKRRPT